MPGAHFKKQTNYGTDKNSVIPSNNTCTEFDFNDCRISIAIGS